jgi:two-component system response regulator AtoC
VADDDPHGLRISATFPRATPVSDEMGDRLNVLVITEHLVISRPLPSSGHVRIGRVSTSDIAIDDRSISRNHAILSIGPPLLLTDLGSQNGTKVGDRKLVANESVQVAPGEVIYLGNATLIVQRRGPPIAAQRFLAHDYFEVRLQEECARQQRIGGAFAVARMQCQPPPTPETLAAILTAEARSGDVLGEYSPSEVEVLLLDTGPDEAAAALGRVVDQLAQRGLACRSGLACFPRDGLSAQELIHAASPLRRKKRDDGSEVSFVGDRRMQDLYLLADRIAAGSITVLILGETGVGKEVMAERVHRASPRAAGPYLRLSCAALSETLLESELFGHEKGAFTGAVQAKPGLLETAGGGTVFLDEVGELPLSIQVKLLRVLEERAALRVGGLKPRPLDVRFVAATNRDLEAEVARGTFRQDLFFRLSGATLVIPPLRERTSEIPGLALAFAAQAAKLVGMDPPPPIDPAALAMMSSYSWPGNIRELRNVIERAVLLCQGGRVTVEHLPGDRMRGPVRRVEAPAAGSEEDRERQRILHVLAACNGNQTEAARMLGIARRTLINRLEQYGISGPRKRRD